MRLLTASLALTPFLTAASNAPLIHNNPFGVTFSATLSQQDATSISGAIKIAAAPNGEGANVQISLYNLPSPGGISYGIHTNPVALDGSCSTTYGLLDPYNGVTGFECKTKGPACKVGDLSARHGPTSVSGGGSGTGYFAASYIDKYLSLRPEDPAYVGGRSFVVLSDDGEYLACANFVNSMDYNSSPRHTDYASSTIAGLRSTTKPYPYPVEHATDVTIASSSIPASADSAVKTAIPLMAAGILGMMAALL